MMRRIYPSDLTDIEWKIIKEIMNRELPYTTGRPVEVDYREIWNAIFYINRTGCQWRYLPHDFPPYTTVNYHYLKWMRCGLYQKVNDALRRQAREQAGRNAEPSAGIIDSQSVKGTPESAKESGFDGGKLVKGRCQVPCDYIPTGKSPLFLAREIFKSLIHELTDESQR